jgi:hypothetical protein
VVSCIRTDFVDRNAIFKHAKGLDSYAGVGFRRHLANIEHGVYLQSIIKLLLANSFFIDKIYRKVGLLHTPVGGVNCGFTWCPDFWPRPP